MKKCLLLLITFVTCHMFPAFSQPGSWLQGYTSDVKGEVLTYHSPHPEVFTSLLIRNQDSTKYIEWLMDEIPRNTDTQEFTFVWIFGIDVNESTYEYKLFLDDKYVLSFNNPGDTLTTNWSIKGVEDITLEFHATLVDKYGDLMGYAFLQVPHKLLKEGEKPRIRITASSSDDPSWYMTHRYALNSNIMVKQMPAVMNTQEGEAFVLRFDIHHFGEKTNAEIQVKDQKTTIPISLGVNYTYIPVSSKVGEKISNINISIDEKDNRLPEIIIRDVKPMMLYLLHHSHADIGYTHHQDVVEAMHHDFFREVTQHYEDTKDYPEGARFKWNTEVAWAVESYLKHAGEEEREHFIRAVQDGGIEIGGLWTNELTGLCSREELIQLVQRSSKVAQECGVKLSSAMITDIPGYTWSLVPVMAKSGIKYFSPGTNVFHRIGDIKDTWGDKPFYWVSNSGKDSVLTWFPARGYSWFHTGLGSDKPKNLLTEEPIFEYVDQLYSESFPYDISIFRYNIGSDNGPPQAELPEIIKRWNEKYVTPKIHIATTTEAFSVFEDKYGDVLPSFGGDLTPYWEDGAASSAKETALVRKATDKLEQAMTLWVMSQNEDYPTSLIDQAWKYILLYNEHTWGSWNSISAPHDPFTINQWKTKKSFAIKADSLATLIMDGAMNSMGQSTESSEYIFDVWNTHSWPVTDVVMLPVPGEMENVYARDINNNLLKSQVMANGKLAVLVADVAPFASKRIYLETVKQQAVDPEPYKLQSDFIVVIDEVSGDVKDIFHTDTHTRLVNESEPFGLNSYLYVEGRDPINVQSTSNTQVSFPERGDLVKSILIESDAPGTQGLTREIVVMEGLDRIDITNTIQKSEVYEPEGVHFGFPFLIPEGDVRIGQAWNYYQPQAEQLPGSNQNYYTLSRWADISNKTSGVCLVSIDAPLLEIGEITNDATVFGWKDKQKPSQSLFSYVMNNYWETNYLAAQPGEAVFRYSIYPHRAFDPVFNIKRSLERTQTLLVISSSGENEYRKSLIGIDNQNTLITNLIPQEDQDVLVRIYNPTSEKQHVNLHCDPLSKNKAVFYKCGLSGQDKILLEGALSIPAFSFETLLVEYN